MAHEILLNSGDSIDEADLQTAFAAMGKGYIEQDALDIQYFDSDDTIDTTPALARVPNNNRDIPLFVDAITGYSLEANAVNSVWLIVDPSAATDDEAVGLTHNTTGVEPSDPHLLIAEVDTNQSGSDAVALRNRGTAPSLSGADMNPRSIGREQALAELIADAATIGDLQIDTIQSSGGGLVLDEVTTDQFQLTSGPVIYSSFFDSIQQALDAAAGGELVINDTKTEEGIAFGPEHSGTTVRCVGGHGIEQPASPTQGTAVMQGSGADGEVADLTFIDLRISNPALADGDIDNEDTLSDQNNRTSAVEWSAPNVGTITNPRRIKFIRPHIDHVNGYGIAIQGPLESYIVRDGNISHVCYDGTYCRTYGADVAVTYDGNHVTDCGRHNFAIAGDAAGNRAYVSGIGERAYTAGLDIEHGMNVTVDLTVVESGRATEQTGSTSALHSGLYVSDPSSRVGGHLRSFYPKGHSAYLKAPPDGLTISHTDGVRQSVQNTPPVWFDYFEGGEATVIADGGGAKTDAGGPEGAIHVRDVRDFTLTANVREAWGPSLDLASVRYSDIDLTTINPNQAKGTPFEEGHIIARHGDEGIHTRHNDIAVQARETNDYTNNIVTVPTQGNANYNRYSGVVAGAFIRNTVYQPGENSDQSDFL